MILFLDGQHHLATAQLAAKWTAVNTGVTPGSTTWTVAAEGRTANCIKGVQTITGAAGYLEVAPLMTNYGAWVPNSQGVCGFAVKVSSLTKLATSPLIAKTFFSIYEGSGRIFYVTLNPNGTFSHNYHEEAPFDSGYMGSSTQGLRSNTWAYVEFKWTISTDVDSDDGRWTTRLNTVQIFDVTGRVYGSSTTFSYLGVWDAVRILQLPFTATSESVRMCDFYLADQETHSTDYVLSDFAGDGTIGAIYPEAVGTYAEWTPLSGANVDNVKEHPPDDDTTYVAGADTDLRDSHVMQDVPIGAVILAYQALVYAKRTSVGSAVIKPTRRMGGVDYTDDGQGVASSDEYAYILQPYDNDPADGTQATEADINGMEAGYKKA